MGSIDVRVTEVTLDKNTLHAKFSEPINLRDAAVILSKSYQRLVSEEVKTEIKKWFANFYEGLSDSQSPEFKLFVVGLINDGTRDSYVVHDGQSYLFHVFPKEGAIETHTRYDVNGEWEILQNFQESLDAQIKDYLEFSRNNS